MFHTPPVKNDWQPDASIANSYNTGPDLDDSNINSNMPSDNDLESQPATLDTAEINLILKKSIDVHNSDKMEDNDDSESNNKSSAITFSNNVTKVSDNTKTIPSDNSSFIESFEVPTEMDLPIELINVYEQFLRELKEPKFERSLASFEISELFHSFYQRFQVACIKYIDQGGRYELYDQNHSNKGYQYYRYNLILERLLCDKFYSQIIFPLKNIPIDEYEREMNDQFCDKLGCLSSLDIHFKHLDIDLPADIEMEFIRRLNEKILPEFEFLTAERSPTLKMKYLIKIHKKIGVIINELTKSSNGQNSKSLNTDIYLPVLIFTIIKLKELRAYFLVRQLNLIKRFTNEYIYDNSVESLQSERGELLYVCANFEAAISYLANVTLDNLEMGLPSEDINLLPGSLKDRNELLLLLTTPLKLESIEVEAQKFKELNPLFKFDNSITINSLSLNNSWIDYSKLTLPNTVINADQGLKSISLAIDSSLKNIMGKVSWLSGSADDMRRLNDESTIGDITNDEITNNTNNNNNSDLNITSLPDSLLKQLEENDAFQHDINDKIHILTPNLSLESTAKDTFSNGGIEEKINENYVDNVHSRNSRSESTTSTQERLISKFTNSMGGVMKSFRPMGEFPSSTSLNVNENMDSVGNEVILNTIKNNIQNNSEVLERSSSTGFLTTPNKNNGSNNNINNLRLANNMRSRATSFINTSLFGSPNNQFISNEAIVPTTSSSPPKENRNSIFSTLENALDNVRNRSRDNSLSENHHDHPQIRIVEDINKLKRFEKSFDEMKMSELNEMYNNYNYIMSKVAKMSKASRNGTNIV